MLQHCCFRNIYFTLENMFYVYFYHEFYYVVIIILYHVPHRKTVPDNYDLMLVGGAPS